jgi:hypothetical protein
MQIFAGKARLEVPDPEAIIDIAGKGNHIM